MPAKRAIGIVRVSQVGGRAGESFASPKEQRERIEVACKRESMQLAEVYDELDVSGGRPLAKRPGLRAAVEAIEAGKADVVIAAYFDRLLRSVPVKAELVKRVEDAGGEVIALDVGQVSDATATRKLNGTLLAAFAEYQRDTAKERSGDAQRRAVARGVAPYPHAPGYTRGEDGRFVPNEQAPIIRRAFEMRDEGQTIRAIRAYLNANGIEQTYSGTYVLLKTRVVLGELHFGDLVNTDAHEPIVDAELWRRVQRISVPKGRRPKSELLLARLGILRCASCGSPMCGGSSHGGTSTFYRCTSPSGDCPAKVTISTTLAERAVVEEVKRLLSDVEGRASAQTNIHAAERALEQAQDALSGAIRTLADFTDEPATRERLAALRQARDDAQTHLDQVGGASTAVTLTAAGDWDRLTRDERRALVCAMLEKVTVAPGRGSARLGFHPA